MRLAAIRNQFSETLYKFASRFFKHKRPETLPLTLRSGRVYVLPTRFGVFFALFTFVMLLGSLNYNNNMALMLVYLLLSLGLIAPIYTVRNLSGVRVTGIHAEPTFAGETAHFQITLLNESSKHRPVIWATGALSTNAHDPENFDITSLPAHGGSTLDAKFPTHERGWQIMGRTRIGTGFPLGLFFSWVWLEADYAVLVYPKPESNAPPLPQSSHRGTGTLERTGDEEWSGLREYRPGDPSRWIAWKAVARTGHMVTKTFADHRSQELILDYHQINQTDAELRLSRLCRWILECSEQQAQYTLRLPGMEIGPDRGEDHKHLCLKALAEFRG